LFEIDIAIKVVPGEPQADTPEKGLQPSKLADHWMEIN
jgi:hypothetical protein